jgi:hypothetical protein
LAQRCPIISEADDLLLERARAWLDLAAQATNSGRNASLSRAKASLSALSAARGLGVDARRIDLDIALRTGDATAAHVAWRGYLSPEGSDIPRTSSIFASGLSPEAGDEARCALVMLLVRTGLFDSAQGLYFGRMTPQNRASLACSPVRSYERLRASIEAAVSTYNNAAARGEGDGDTLRRAVERAFEEAAGAVAPNRRDTREVLREVWGLHYALGLSEGFMSLHAGHAVKDERRTISQFRRTGVVRFVALDGMISNGYISWLWDGAAAAGGWTEGSATIVQVRSAYAHGGFRALDLTAGRAARAAAEEQVAELERSDRAALAARPVTYLRGLAARLELQVVDAIARDARGLDEPFEGAFLRLFNEALTERAFFIHEGRHVLDRRSGASFAGRARVSSQAERTGTGALSEIGLRVDQR